MNKTETSNCCVIEIVVGELYKGFTPLCMETENIRCKHKPNGFGMCLYRKCNDNGDICASVGAIHECISMVKEYIVEINNHIDKNMKTIVI
jgi:hypothetical protein